MGTVLAKLTPRRQVFVREYLFDRNATQAAIRAGYSPRTAKMQGSRLLTFDDVKQAIATITQKLAAENELNADWVLKRLMQDADLEPGAPRSAALGLLSKCLGMQLDRHHHTGSLTLERLLELAGMREDEQPQMLNG